MDNRIYTDYLGPKDKLRDQLKSGSSRRKMNPVLFFFKKLRNYLLAMLAYNCPLNGWRVRMHKWRGVKIGKNVTIGFHVTIDNSYPEYVTLEDNASLSGDNYILTHTTPKIHWKSVMPSYIAPVTIKEGAWLTIGAKVLPGVTVGEYSIIAAGSIVNKDVPPKVLVGGVPAKVIKPLDLDF